MYRIITFLTSLILIAGSGSFAASPNEDPSLGERIAACQEYGATLARPGFVEGIQQHKDLSGILLGLMKGNSPLCGILAESLEHAFSQEEVLKATLALGISKDSLAKAAVDAGFDRAIVAQVLGVELFEGLGYTPSSPVTSGNPFGIIRGSTVSPSSL